MELVAWHAVARCQCAKAHGATKKGFSIRKVCSDFWECSYMSRVTTRRFIVRGKMGVTRWSWWRRHAVARTVCVCQAQHRATKEIFLVLKVGSDCWECSYMSRVTLRRIIVHGKMRVTWWSWWCGKRWHGACVPRHTMQPRNFIFPFGKLVFIV